MTPKNFQCYESDGVDMNTEYWENEECSANEWNVKKFSAHFFIVGKAENIKNTFRLCSTAECEALWKSCWWRIYGQIDLYARCLHYEPITTHKAQHFVLCMFHMPKGLLSSFLFHICCFCVNIRWTYKETLRWISPTWHLPVVDTLRLARSFFLLNKTTFCKAKHFLMLWQFFFSVHIVRIQPKWTSKATQY